MKANLLGCRCRFCKPMRRQSDLECGSAVPASFAASRLNGTFKQQKAEIDLDVGF